MTRPAGRLLLLAGNRYYGPGARERERGVTYVIPVRGAHHTSPFSVIAGKREVADDASTERLPQEKKIIKARNRVRKRKEKNK